LSSLVADSMRLAMLTTSPIAVNCIFCGWPISPMITEPTWMPMPMRNSVSNCLLMYTLSSRRLSSMPSPAATASRQASAAVARSSPKIAMMPSPMYLSM
jgi:hypothetical protein